jgi:hypothetical protein
MDRTKEPMKQMIEVLTMERIQMWTNKGREFRSDLQQTTVGGVHYRHYQPLLLVYEFCRDTNGVSGDGGSGGGGGGSGDGAWW